MRKVLLATPAHDGRVHVHYADSLVKTVKLAAQMNCDIIPGYVVYDALVQRARNDLVKIAVEYNFDDVVFIDADQQWNPEWVFRLLRYPVDVVGAPVRKKSDVESYNVRSITLPIPIDPSTGLLIVDGIGAGFLRLSAKAIAAIWNASPEYTDNERRSRMVFNVQIVDGQLRSEDNVFCDRLRALGFNVYVDQEITCSHIGPKKWDGDFKGWLQHVHESLERDGASEVSNEVVKP